ncbi:MAG: acetolactate synthase small subunit [Fibrobacteres bacterium]|nr:acetolactate synthase small subunit [Fibrobacterota bacterium]
MADSKEFHTIIVTVLNRVGVVARVTGLFSARGYNIENMIAAPTETKDVYKIYIGITATEKEAEQVVKQLNKLIDTLKVADISHKNHYITREFVLLRITCKKNRSEILELVNVFRAKTVDVTEDHITVDMSGPGKKVERFIELVKPFGIEELVRTGKLAITENDSEK